MSWTKHGIFKSPRWKQESLDFSLLAGQDNKKSILRQHEDKRNHSYDERFANWVMVEKGMKKRDVVWKAYRIGKIQREYGTQILSLQEAERVAALILASDYQRSIKRHKLYVLEDWIRFQGLSAIHFKKPRATERCPTYLNLEQLSSLIHAVDNYREYAIIALFSTLGRA